MFYVYVYYSRSVPFYVGKGKNGRWKEHLSRPEFIRRPEITVRVEFFDDEQDALLVESYLIRCWWDKLENIAQPCREGDLSFAENALSRFSAGVPVPVDTSETLKERLRLVLGEARYLMDERAQERDPAWYDCLVFARTMLRSVLLECIKDQELTSQDYRSGLDQLRYINYFLQGIRDDVLAHPTRTEQYYKCPMGAPPPKWPQKFMELAHV